MKYQNLKKSLLRLNFSLFIFFLFILNLYAYDFKILKYKVEIILLKNSSAQITEKIDVFFNIPRRGIIRFIPYRYKKGIFNDNLRIKIVSVERNGSKEKYKVFKRGRNIFLRIGHKDKYLEGENRYKITYIVDNAIKFFENHDEFYWNVIGTNWKVPIDEANFEIFYPETDVDKINCKIFIGRFLEKNEINFYELGNDYLTLKYPVSLPPQTGITIGLAFPKKIFKNKNFIIRWWWFFIDNFGLFIPVFTFIIMFLIWWYAGRDEKKGVIVVQYYPPEDLTPGEAGVLIDEKVDLRDIIATILSLADKGFLKIIKEKDKIYFEKLKDKSEELKIHEKIIYDGIFKYGDKVSLDLLKGTFFYTIENASTYLYDLLSNKEKLFSANPEEIRALFKKIGIMILFSGILILFYGLAFARWDIGAGTIISGIIIILFSRIMPQKTHKGAELYRKLLGFKEFMDKVEKPVLEKLIKEDKNYFSKTLPYAVAFNLEKNWVKKFDGIDFKVPEWYIYPGIYGYYTPLMFYSLLANDLNLMHESFSIIPQGESSFSNIDITGGTFSGGGFGGGFSGGGFGGGGGGSW